MGEETISGWHFGSMVHDEIMGENKCLTADDLKAAIKLLEGVKLNFPAMANATAATKGFVAIVHPLMEQTLTDWFLEEPEPIDVFKRYFQMEFEL